MSIANEIIRLGGNICFLVSDSESEKFFESAQMPVEVLGTRWDNLSDDIGVIETYLDDKVTAIVVDSYFVSQEYIEMLRKHLRVVYIDDFIDQFLMCDILVNYSIYAEDIPYREKGLMQKCLLGLEYVPLRSDFMGVPIKRIADIITDVLVITGGADKDHFMLNLIKAIGKNNTSFEGIKFNFICGRYNNDISEMKRIIEKTQLTNIMVRSQIENVSEFMKRTDVAISAGGVTLYELAACGVPTLTVAFADNQLWNVKKFNDCKLMENIGDIRDNGFSYKRVLERLSNLINDKERRRRESVQLQMSVDGYGAQRIAKQIISLA